MQEGVAIMKRKLKKRVVVIGILGILLLILGSVYFYFSSAVDRRSTEYISIVILPGASTTEIASTLRENELIRNELFFKVYARMHGFNSLQASTYQLNQNMNLREILTILSEGNSYDPNIISITFREGENIMDYARRIASATNHSEEEVISVMNDRELLKEWIEEYWFLTDEILNDDLFFALEGYLAPNTYQFRNKDVSIEEIVVTLLNQTKAKLAPLRESMENGPFTVHEYLAIASILQLEGTNLENRKDMSAVIVNRLRVNMSLGMDPTAYYANQVPKTRDLTVAEFNLRSPFNTRGPGMEGRLPVGPICNPDIDAIFAAVYPNENDYLFFVADNRGVIFFTRTYAEHNAKILEIRAAGNWIW